MNAKDLKKLKKSLVDAGTNGILAKPADVADLITAGLVEVNTAVAPNADGMIPARATAKLAAELGAKLAAAPVAKATFAIVDAVPFVPGVRGGVKEEVYPFSKLEVGQSFVVPVSEDKPTPEKVVEKFGSTVSSATRRFAVETGETRTNKKGKVVPVLKATRKFTLRPITVGQTYPNSTFVETVSGARVFRIA